MKIGIIIVFNHCETAIIKQKLIKSFNKVLHVEFCLVNNNGGRSIYESLTEITEYCKNTNVVNIKKNKSDSSAVRAGARYMHNQFKLKYIGYITGLSSSELFEIIDNFATYQNDILTQIRYEKQEIPVRQTFFQSIFSVCNYIELINVK